MQQPRSPARLTEHAVTAPAHRGNWLVSVPQDKRFVKDKLDRKTEGRRSGFERFSGRDRDSGGGFRVPLLQPILAQALPRDHHPVLSIERESVRLEIGHVKIEDAVADTGTGSEGLGDLGREWQVVPL